MMNHTHSAAAGLAAQPELHAAQLGAVGTRGAMPAPAQQYQPKRWGTAEGKRQQRDPRGKPEPGDSAGTHAVTAVWHSPSHPSGWGLFGNEAGEGCCPHGCQPRGGSCCDPVPVAGCQAWSWPCGRSQPGKLASTAQQLQMMNVWICTQAHANTCLCRAGQTS